MIERLPCKPAATSWRPIVEWVALCLLMSLILYLMGV